MFVFFDSCGEVVGRARICDVVNIFSDGFNEFVILATFFSLDFEHREIGVDNLVCDEHVGGSRLGLRVEDSRHPHHRWEVAGVLAIIARGGIECDCSGLNAAL